MQDVVTVLYGGTDGLGLALAQQRVALGEKVVILGRDNQKAELIARQIGAVGLSVNVVDPNSLQASVVTIMQRFGRIDRCVYSAGFWKDGLTGDYSFSTITQLISVNQTAPIMLTQLVVPIMKSQETGQLVYIVSKDALYAKKNRSVYHASKWGLRGYIQCLRHDLAGLPISVLAIYPGLMRTKLFEKSGTDRALDGAMEPWWVAAAISANMQTSLQGAVTELHLDPQNELVVEANAPV